VEAVVTAQRFLKGSRGKQEHSPPISNQLCLEQTASEDPFIACRRRPSISVRAASDQLTSITVIAWVSRLTSSGI
jgi:hypothetical protein